MAELATLRKNPGQNTDRINQLTSRLNAIRNEKIHGQVQASVAKPAAGGSAAWSESKTPTGQTQQVARSGTNEARIIPSAGNTFRASNYSNGKQVSTAKFVKPESARTYGEYFVKHGQELPPSVATGQWKVDTRHAGATGHGGPWVHSKDSTRTIVREPAPKGGFSYRFANKYGSSTHFVRDTAFDTGNQDYRAENYEPD